MDPSLKRRLFIAIIIVALVVIFLPIPFGHLHFEKPSAKAQEIPPMPKQPKVKPTNSTKLSSTRAVQNFKPIGPVLPIANLNSNNMHPPMATTASLSTSATTSVKETSDETASVNKEPIQSRKQPSFTQQAKAHKSNHPAVVSEQPVHHLTQTHTVEKTRSHEKITRKHKQHHKSKVVEQADDASIVEQIGENQGKPVYLTQSALNNVLPKLNIRKDNLTSSNAVMNQQIRKNIAVANKMNKAWVVQLGSFNDPKRTSMVVEKLRKEGFAAFSYKKKVDDQEKYRVYVGPFLKQEQAEAKLKYIEKHFKMPGYVHSFKASKLD